MSAKDFSKSGRAGYYRQAMVLSGEDAVNKTDQNFFPQGLIGMIIWAGMAKPSQNGPRRGNAGPRAEYILKTRDLQILLTQWQAPAPKQCILVRWDSEDLRCELRETLLQSLSEFVIYPETISTSVVPSSIPSYSSLSFQCCSFLLFLHPEKGFFSSKPSCPLNCLQLLLLLQLLWLILFPSVPPPWVGRNTLLL